MKKRVILLAIVIIFLMNILCVGIFATDDAKIVPYRFTNINTVTFNMSFVGNTGYIAGSVEGNPGVTHITATVKLYYKNSNGDWIEIPKNWSYNVYDESLEVDKNFTGTSGVEYKAVLSARVYKNVWEDVEKSTTATCQ